MPLKAGFSEIDITPPVGTLKIGWKKVIVSDTVLDPLYARVAIFESGGECVGFVQLDTLSIRWTQVSQIRTRVTEELGFPGENVMVAARMQDKAHADQARALLADLGLGDKYHRFPHELSGGERQRVVIARAMIHRPRIIFADEPTGLLDRRTGLQVMALLRSYREQGSLIAVTHNPEILSEADLVVTMRDGRITDIKDRITRLAQEMAS